MAINKNKYTLYRNMCSLISLLCTVYYLFILSFTDFFQLCHKPIGFLVNDMCSNIGSICRLQEHCSLTYICIVVSICVKAHMPIMWPNTVLSVPLPLGPGLFAQNQNSLTKKYNTSGTPSQNVSTPNWL